MIEGYQTFDFPDAKGIVVCGDIHGEFNELVYKCCIQYRMTDTLIIVAGDCGFGFERQGYYENVYNHNRERQVMDKLLDYLKSHHHPLRHWFYGHFHQSWHQEIDLVQYNMLDIMELRDLKCEE